MKLLMIDIETTPALVHVWSLFNQNISVDQVVKPTSVLCFAAKWYGDDKVMFHAAVHQDGPAFKAMIKAAHKLLSEADAVCHFNGTTFDIPRLNTEFLKLGMAPPPPIPQIDLKKVVMTKFAMTSSKLAFVGPFLQIGAKVSHEGWPLWTGCMDGDTASWRKMEEYNRQDVVLLEKLYKKVLPWIDQHPNMNLYVQGDKPVCPACASTKLQRRGLERAATYIYRRWLCVACGRWCRERQRDKTEPTTKVR